MLLYVCTCKQITVQDEKKSWTFFPTNNMRAHTYNKKTKKKARWLNRKEEDGFDQPH